MTEQVQASHPFVPGLEVALVTRSGWGSDNISFKTVKVAKLLKNDKFKIEGSDKQWRAVNFRDYTSKTDHWTASIVGDNWDRSGIELITPEFEKRVAASQKAQKLKNMHYNAYNLLGNYNNHREYTDAQIAAIETVILAFNK